VHRAELTCDRVGDDGDVMAAQPVRPALRPCWSELLAWLPAVPARRGESYFHARRWWRLLRVWAHVPVGVGLVVRGRDLSFEAETCRGGPLRNFFYFLILFNLIY
jgi:hypothetical protein